MPIRVDPIMTHIDVVGSQEGLTWVRQWQAEIRHPESWLNKHLNGDRRDFLDAREFTVMCFLDFYKVIMEDTIFESVDLIEQRMVKRKIFQY